MSIVTWSFGWLFWMSVKAPWMPSLAGSIEMSVVTPVKIPVSDMYWIIVMGPNQKRCRGRLGLSAGFMKVNVCKVAVAFVPPPPERVMVGIAVYPEPRFVTLMPVTFPPDILAGGTVPVAVTGELPVGVLKVTVGAEVYPAPGLVMVTRPLRSPVASGPEMLPPEPPDDAPAVKS